MKDKKRLKKILRRTFFVLLGILFLILILHTPPLRNVVKAIASRVAANSVGGQIEIDRIRYNLFRGEAELESVKIISKGLEVQIDHIAGSFYSGDGIRLEVERPRIRMSSDYRPPASGKEPSPRSWLVLHQVDSVRIQNGSVEIRNKSSGTAEILGSMVLERKKGVEKAEDPSWSFSGDLQLRVEDYEPFPLHAEALIALEQDNLHIQKASITALETSVQAQGTLYTSTPLVGDLQGSFQGSDAMTRALGLELPWEGSIKALFLLKAQDSDLAGQGSDLEGRLEIESSRLLLADTGPWDASAELSFDGKIIQIDHVALESDSGSLSLKGTADPKSQQAEIEIRAHDLDPNPLIAGRSDIPWTLASRLSADIGLSLNGVDINQAKAKGKVRLKTQPLEGLPISGDMDLELEKGQLHLNTKDIQVYGSRLTFSGKVGQEDVNVTYDLFFPLSDIPKFSALIESAPPGLPIEGSLNFSGKVTGDLQNPSADVWITSRDLQVRSNTFDLSAHVKANPDTVKIEAAEIASHTGKVQIRGQFPLGETAKVGNVTARFHSFSLPELSAHLGFGIPINGTVKLWGSAKRLTWNADLESRWQNADKPSLQGEISLKALGSQDRISLKELKLVMGSGILTASGTFRADAKSLNARIQGSGFRFEDLQTYAPGLQDLTGDISLDAEVRGSLSSPEATLAMNLYRLVFHGSPLPDISLSMGSEEDTLVFKGYAPEQFLSGDCLLDGEFPLELKIDLAALPIRDLLVLLPEESQLELSTVEGDLRISAPLRSPEALQYRAEIGPIRGSYMQRAWNIVPFLVTGDHKSLTVHDFQLEEGPDTFKLEGVIPLKEEEEFDFRLEGGVDLNLLSEFIPQSEFGGQAQSRLQISGTRAQPHFDGQVNVLQGWGQWRDFGWDNLEVRISGSEEELKLDTFSMNILDGEVRASGRFAKSGTRIESHLVYAFHGLDLGLLLSRQELERLPSLRVSGEGEADSTDFTLAAVTASGRISEISASHEKLQVSLAEPVEWSLREGQFSHSEARIAGEGIDLRPSLKADAGKTPLEWQAKLQGSVQPIIGANFFNASNVRLSGETKVNLDITSQAGNMSGRISTDGGQVIVLDPPLSASQIQTDISIKNNDLDIKNISAQIGRGKVSLSGQLIPDDTSALPKADLSITAENVPYRVSSGIYGQFSGDLRLSGNSQNYILSGKVLIPRILVERELDATSQSLEYLNRELKSLEEERTFSDHITLDLQAELQELQIKNSMADLSAGGTITVTGTPSLPRINGVIHVQRIGHVYVGRADLKIMEGRVTLSGFPDNPPELAVAGITRVRGVTIELNVRGTTENLQAQFFSPGRSDLTTGDLALLIMTGRTTADAGSEAGAILAEMLAADMGEILQKKTGDTVYIDVAPDNSFFSTDADPTTRLSLGTQVSENLFVVYSTALTGDQQRGIVKFDPNKPFWLRYVVEEDGRNIIEINHSLELRLRSYSNRGRDESKNRERISGISFEGDSPLTTEQLRKLTRLKPGKEFDYWKALKGADRIQEKLIKMGYLGAFVEFADRPSAPNQIEAAYILNTGNRIRIVWDGDDVSGGFKKNIQAFWDSNTPEAELPEKLARQAEYALKADKFFQARVTAVTSRTEKETTVQLNVAKGIKGEKISLQFEGNETVPDDDLAKALPGLKSDDFFKAIDTQVGMIRHRIHLILASHGFIQGRVVNWSKAYHADNKELVVTIFIEEGPRSLIDSVNLPHDLADVGQDAGPKLSLSADQPFQLDAYMSDRSALRRYYIEQGFYQPLVTGILKPVGSNIAVSYFVTKGPRARVGEIRTARPGRTRMAKIKSTLTLKEGDLILPTELARSRQRFIETRTYQAVDIRLEESEEGPHIQNLVVDLVEKPEIRVDYGFRYTLPTPNTEQLRSSTEYSPFEVGGRLQFLNPFGNAYRVGVSGYFFGREQFLRLSLESESFFGFRIPTQLYASHSWKPELTISGFQSRANRFTFQQYKRWRRGPGKAVWADKMRIQWNYSFSRIAISSLKTTRTARPIEPVETDRGSVSLAFVGDFRDSFVSPTRGFFATVSTEFARTWLGSDVNFNKLYIQAYLYVPLAEKIVWASGLRIGAIPGDNPALIIEDRFQSGGPYSVRGFPIYYLGPKTDKGEPLGGQAMLVFNQELRFPIYKQLHAGVFYDAGNVFAFAKDMRLGNLRHSAGAGLRYELPFGPIRLDWAYVLDPQPGEKRYRILFTIGHAY